MMRGARQCNCFAEQGRELGLVGTGTSVSTETAGVPGSYGVCGFTSTSGARVAPLNAKVSSRAPSLESTRRRYFDTVNPST
jgi:hypothetical protein